MTRRLTPLLLLALAGRAAADDGSVLLRDGAKLRRVSRLEGAVTSAGLRPVLWSDVTTGRRAPAWIGRRAVVQADDPSSLARLPGVRAVRPLMPSIGLWLVESTAPEEDGLALAERLQRQPGLRQALPDLHFQRRHRDLVLPPDDPHYPGQWFYKRINLEDAWRIESGKPTVTVVVIDDGCDLQHPDLVAKMDAGKDVIDGDDDPSFAPGFKGNNHGTACAGLVAASTGNGVGVAGTCPGCRLRCVRLLNTDPMQPVPLSADVDAFQFVLASGAAVASNSWGYVDPTPVPQPLADAIREVHDNGRGGLGTLVVFAAGNDNRGLGDDEIEGVAGVTTVGAVNNFDELTQFSNFGPSVDVVAPTGTITTDISGADGSDPGDYTSTFGGTSSACPIVAGIFGLMVSAAPDKKASELEALLVSTAKQSPFAAPDGNGHDDHYGFGLVQPALALRALKPLPAPDMGLISTPPSRGCGCDVGARPTPITLAVLLSLLLLGIARRRCRCRCR